jgi:hypothetical protein
MVLPDHMGGLNAPWVLVVAAETNSHSHGRAAIIQKVSDYQVCFATGGRTGLGGDLTSERAPRHRTEPAVARSRLWAAGFRR